MSYRPIKTKKTQSVLQNSTALRRLVERAQALDRLQDLINQYLQPAARPHCRLATYQSGTLTLIVTDGHWATRLRYQQKRLLKQLQSIPEFSQVTRIHFKVRPPLQVTQPTARNIELSEQAGQAIQTSAEATTDPRLRAALERLAGNAQQSSDAN